MKNWMEFIKQPNATPEYGGRVLVSKDVYEEIQREAINNHCRNCHVENGKFTHINPGSTECTECGATDTED